MKKSYKILSAVLSSSLILTMFTSVMGKNDIYAHETREIKYNLEDGEWILYENSDYLAVIKVIDKIGHVKIILKHKDVNAITVKEKDTYKEEVQKYIDNLKMDRNPLVLAGAIFTIVAGVATIDLGYIKPQRDEYLKVINTYNGWVSLNGNGKTLWMYKINGKFKKGWHWDNYYKAWYYFYDAKISTGYNQTYAALMYSAKYNPSWLKLNNKWYEFYENGKLIQHSGWRKYNNKWLYHLPGDYGAIANQSMKIDGKWYTFDSNGYWV